MAFQPSRAWRKSRAPRHGKARNQNPRGSKKKSLALPDFVAPQLATLVDAPPPGADWIHEIKYDGYRAVTSVAGDDVAVRTRNGLDWTDKFSGIARAVSRLPCQSALLDGEIAVADAAGRTDFGELQNALSTGSGGFTYYVFDLLECDGEDLRDRPLVERKRLLKTLLRDPPEGLLYSDHVEGSGDDTFAKACELHLEGVISKLADAPYRSGRSTGWLKSKCGHEQEFVLIGWRPSDKAGRPFRSLLLGLRENGALRYAGRVGSGYSGATLDTLAREFKKLERKTPAVDGVPRAIARHAHFLEPALVAQIAFRGWTRDGLVRQGSFKGLRQDKEASEVVREQEKPAKIVRSVAARRTSDSKRASPRASAGKASGKKTAARKSSARKSPASKKRASKSSALSSTAHDGSEMIEGVRVTHPDKVLFPGQGVTKRALIAHYLSIADRILPHIARRPLSLVRCPAGSAKQCFFQKHASDGFPEQFLKVRIRETSGSADYLYIEDERGLIASVQVGVLELHLWGCHIDDVEKPDRLVFDFDPDEGLDFGHVRDAARDMRARLKKLGLESFPMVTGGKGIHVVVPLTRGHSWDQHKDFAEALARLMEEEEPERFVANMSKAKRKGRIFVDYLRNQRGATAISPFSTRARPGAYFSVPVSWAALAKLTNAHPAAVGDAEKFTKGRDPWGDYFKLRQSLPRL